VTDEDARIAFYRAIAKKANEAVGGQGELTSIDVGSNGNFPYNYMDSNNVFVASAWEYLNRLCVPQGRDHIKFSDIQVGNRYEEYLGHLSYRLSSKDQSALNANHIYAQESAQQVVAQYEELYGTITPEMMTSVGIEGNAKIDYIINYKLGQWAKPNKLQLSTGNIKELTDQLPNAPSSVVQLLLPLIVQYLGSSTEVLGIVNASGNARQRITSLKTNTRHPSADNGGLTTNDNKVHIKYNISQQPDQIVADLKNLNRTFSVTMNAERFDENKAHLAVDGNVGGDVDWGFFTVGGGVSVNYQLDKLSTSTDKIEITLDFTGLCDIRISPSPFQQDTQQGWWDPEPIQNALHNRKPDGSGYKDVSGYILEPFSEDIKVFGVLERLVVANFPTIKISYSAGKASELAQSLTERSELTASVFGIPLFSAEQEYSEAKIEKHSSGEGFTVSMKQSDPTGSALGQRAYVVGAWVDRSFDVERP